MKMGLNPSEGLWDRGHQNQAQLLKGRLIKANRNKEKLKVGKEFQVISELRSEAKHN